MSTGERRRVLLGLVIAAQFAVPTIALFQEPPTRFGFQMYSAQGWTKVEAVTATGEPVDVRLQDHLAGSLRPEIDWTGVLPERICVAYPEAARVTVSQPQQSRSVRC